MIKKLICITFAVLFCVSQSYAQTACTALTTAGTLTGSECMATDQSGNARSTSPDAILTHIHENELLTISNKTLNYTAALTDLKDYINFSSTTNLTFTIPPLGDVAFQSGSYFEFGNTNTHTLIIAPGSGVTLNGTLSYSSAGSIFGKAIKIDDNIWNVQPY